MLRLCCVCFALIVSAPVWGMEPSKELDYAIDQPLMTIRDTEVRFEDGEVAPLNRGIVVHIDWDDGDRLLTTIEGERVTLSRADLRPIRQAVDCFTEQLKTNPNCLDLYLRRSHAHDLLGRLQDSASDLESARKLDLINSRTGILRGIHCIQSGDFGGAWCEAELLRVFDPLNPYGSLLSATVALKLNDHEAFKSYLAEALELNPDPNDAQIQRFLATAAAFSTKTPEDWEVVLDMLNEVVRLDPYDYIALDTRWKAHRQLDHAGEASADMAACRRLYDGWIKGCPENPRFWSARGQLFLELKSLTESLADFNEAIRLDSNNAELREYRQSICIKLRDYRGALDDLNWMVQSRPRNSDYRMQRAAMLFKIGEARQAIAEYDEVLRDDPGHGQAHRYRAGAAITVRDWRIVESELRFLLSNRSMVDISDAQLATLAVSVGDEAQALSLLQRDPDQSEGAQWSYRLLARRALYRCDSKAAQAMLAQSGALDHQWQYLNAISRYLEGDVDGARDELTQIYVAGTKFQIGKNKETKSTTKTDDKVKSGEVKGLRDEVVQQLSVVVKKASEKAATAAQTDLETEPEVISQSDETAQVAQFLQGLFEVQHSETSRGIKALMANGAPACLNGAYLYAMVRIHALDRHQPNRSGSFATKQCEVLLKNSDTPGEMRIPLYEAMAAGHAELGNFNEATSWQRRILDEVPRDHPRRAWYWDNLLRYMRNEKYPLGETDPELVMPVLRYYLDLEGAPALLSPLPPPLPE